MVAEMIILFWTPFLYLFFLTLFIWGIRILLQFVRYHKSAYGVISGNRFLKTIFSKGNYGEFLAFCILEKMGEKNKLLTNIYLPKDDGTTTEIDLLMINMSGIYVFESKNYSGWIFGDEKSKTWTQSLQNKQKNKFMNPIWQNKGHIGALKNILPNITDNLFYSYIVFSERCELKKVTVTTSNVAVTKRNKLAARLNMDMADRLNVLTSEQVNNTYKELLKYTKVDESVKKQHIENIQSRRVSGK